ncbi:ATP-binding protein [Candidatus Pyrohabitans sp.]
MQEMVGYLHTKLSEAPILARENTQRTNGEYFRHTRAYFRLKKHVDAFIKGDSNRRLILFPGLRGVGKTTALLQIYLYLTRKLGIEPSRVLYISVDELRSYIGSGIYEAVKAYVEEIHRSTLPGLKKQLFILVDEAHFDEKWSVAVKVVYDQSRNISLILTGSSALSMEMSVDLARRAVKEPAFPLNFSEHLILKYGFFPPRGTANCVKNLMFNPGDVVIDISNNILYKIMHNTIGIGKPLEKELEDYLLTGGFPFSLELDARGNHNRIFDMVDRIVEKDVFSIGRYRADTRNTISRIIYFLALQKPGGVSDVKLAGKLNTSPSLVRSILETLEKTHLIVSIKPYGGAGRIVRKPWKYYFLAPSINAAIRTKLGAHLDNIREQLGLLVENMVVFYLFRMKETIGKPLGIFYDPKKRGADFLIQKSIDEIVPVEVGIGRKGRGQIKRSIREYGAEYGVVLSSGERVRREGNVTFIPLTLFSFV